MKIHGISSFKNPQADTAWFQAWVSRLESHTQRNYSTHWVNTSLGKTVVYGCNATANASNTLIIFPGARTTSLIWDFDSNLDAFSPSTRIFMVETNGLPNLSDGASPDIRSLDYGTWANEVFQGLNIEKAHIAGASFGGLNAMKLALVQPERIQSVFLLNPGCLQPFSLHWRNLYYNIKPIVAPSTKNVQQFLNAAIFCKPNHQCSAEAEQLLIDYEVFALIRHIDNAQKPYAMNSELNRVNVPIHLLLGDRDLLFPCNKSHQNALKHLKNLKHVEIFSQVGHGIETYRPALEYVANQLY